MAEAGQSNRRGLRVWLALLALLVPLSAGAGEERHEAVTLFAAASTIDAVNEIAETYAAKTGGSIRPVVAASSTLARQIAQGAPADLFLSASIDWMDHLQQQGMIEPSSRLALLSNRLVLVSPRGSNLQIDLAEGAALREALGSGRLAIGDPAHVPAGIYARQALEALGLWDQIAGRLAQAGNVRMALALVDRGEAAAGIVYETDAAISDGVRVVSAFPAAATPRIAYPLAIVTGRGNAAVRAVYDFLKGEEAAAIFRKHGFTATAWGS